MGNTGKSLYRELAFVCTVIGLQAALVACNSSDTFTGPITVGPSPQPSSLGNTNLVLQTYKPALAVRGMECLICHAQVNSSIITDFGYGDAQFFMNQRAGDIYGQSSVFDNNSPLTLPWYGNYYGTWQLATQITGTIVVPKVTISDTRLLNSIGASAPVSLAQLLSLNPGSHSVSYPSEGFYGDTPYSGAGPIDSMVTPVAGNPTVSEIDQMYIGAPTSSQILGVTPNPSNLALGVQAIGATSSISGLSVVAGSSGSYITNTASGGVINCFGDVVVTGTLFLDNVTVNTDNNGCRILVTQSAFIQGQVNYSSTAGTENLQISSARAVLMGFDTTTLAYRLQGTNWYPDSQPLTRYAGTNTQKNAAIMAEANVIGASLHDTTDASACPNNNMVTYTGYNGSYSTSLTQCAINFQRLLINAPDIESRYVGQFKGVAIAEIALFAPGALNFAYDSTFDTVPILPLLPPLIDTPGIPGCTGPLCGGGIIGI